MSDMQEKDTSAPHRVPEGTGAVQGSQNTSLFKGNEALLFALKKSQKLASAVYLVTDLVPEAEPLRGELRERAVALVKDIVKAASSRQPSLLSARVFEVLSLLEVASGARLISPMNAEVLKKEYERVLEVVSRGDQRLTAPATILSEDLFQQETPSVPSPLSLSVPPSEPFKTAAPRTQQNTDVRTHSIGHKGQNQSVTKERSVSIIELLKKNGRPLSIKDIVTHIKGVGEKTVQRELGALVAQGVLKREGERRWSRYSLR